VPFRSRPLIAFAAAFLRRRASGLLASRWRVNKLAVWSLALRMGLTAVIASAAWQLILLSRPLGAIRWGILVPAIAAVTAIFFAEMLDLEAAAAGRALRAAVFTADRWGGRAETVRTHAQEYVRCHGRCPEGAFVLQDIYTGSPFTVIYGKAH
jgi:hypothetical protein